MIKFILYWLIKNIIINTLRIHTMHFGHIYLFPNSTQISSYLLNFM